MQQFSRTRNHILFTIFSWIFNNGTGKCILPTFRSLFIHVRTACLILNIIYFYITYLNYFCIMYYVWILCVILAFQIKFKCNIFGLKFQQNIYTLLLIMRLSFLVDKCFFFFLRKLNNLKITFQKVIIRYLREIVNRFMWIYYHSFKLKIYLINLRV
jgi:hypothetical protein